LTSPANAFWDITNLQINEYPNLFNAIDIPENDSLILKKVGIASEDLLNDIYQDIVTNNTTDIKGTQELFIILYDVAGVS
jgi:hypothetical protein